MAKKKIAFLFDKKNDWIFYLFNKYPIKHDNFIIKSFFERKKITNFDIVFLLGYTKKVSNNFLNKNNLTLVVHESDLPNGRGFSPIQWQLLEGKSEITISLIEVTEDIDGGDIFLQSKMRFNGTELYEEIRDKQAKATRKIIKTFLNKFPKLNKKKQFGKGSIYPKRKPQNSQLNIKKSIEENFNLLRIGNNDSWPSFFIHKGIKYILKIYKG